MKYSEKTGLYLPGDMHAKAEARPNFPPRMSDDAAAKGERVVMQSWQTYPYWENDRQLRTRGDARQ